MDNTGDRIMSFFPPNLLVTIPARVGNISGTVTTMTSGVLRPADISGYAQLVNISGYAKTVNTSSTLTSASVIYVATIPTSGQVIRFMGSGTFSGQTIWASV